MALQGKIIKLPNEQLGIQCDSYHHAAPEIIRHVWAIECYRLSGMSYCCEGDAIDKPATIQDGRVSCYLGNGNYLRGELKDGGSTRAISVETIAVPMPRVRNGTKTRWRDGCWQKYLRTTGWVSA